MSIEDRIATLREQAARQQQQAQYADDPAAYRADRQAADRLRRLAERLEQQAANDDPTRRRAHLAAIHRAKAELVMEDDDYRAVIARVTQALNGAAGSSAADLVPGERRALLDEFRRLGWKGTRSNRSRRPTPGAERGALISKIEALLKEKGRLDGTDIPWAYADGIAKRVAKVEAVRFADPEGLRKIVAALTYHLKRLRAAAGEAG